MSFRTTAVTPLLLVLLAATFVVLAVLVAGGASDGFDASVIALVRSAALELPLAPLRHVTELGSTWAVTIVAVVTLLLGVVLRRPRTGAAGAVTIALASLVNGFAKIAVARARPDLLEPIVEEHGFSFPSGHAALSMVAYGVVAVLVARSPLSVGWRRTICAGLGLVIFLVGVSRVWLGVHYPTDVLAGWAAGGVVVLAFAALSRPGLMGPAGEAVGADRAAPRSDRPAPESAARRD